MLAAFNWIGGGYNSVNVEEATTEAVLEAVKREFPGTKLEVNVDTIVYGDAAREHRDGHDFMYAGWD